MLRFCSHRFNKILTPKIITTVSARIYKEWDCTYIKRSRRKKKLSSLYYFWPLLLHWKHVKLTNSRIKSNGTSVCRVVSPYCVGIKNSLFPLDFPRKKKMADNLKTWVIFENEAFSKDWYFGEWSLKKSGKKKKKKNEMKKPDARYAKRLWYVVVDGYFFRWIFYFFAFS